MTAYDPEAYAGLPGAIPFRTKNVPPFHGERLIGYVPFGLTSLELRNAGGKSRALVALEAIPLPKLGEGMLVPTRGERDIAVGLGTWELRLEEGAAPEPGKPGRRRTKRTAGSASDGPITTLPEPIEQLVTGDHRVSEEVRWARRLRALLAFCPVKVTEERLLAVAGPVVLPPPNEDLRDALVNRHAQQAFASLLDAAEFLAGPRGLLNARALEAEKKAQEALGEEDRQTGTVEAVLRQAAAGAELEPDDPAVERALLNTSPQAVGAPERYREAERAHARLEAEVEARRAEEARRERLRASHGERPDLAAAEALVERANAVRVAQDARIAELREAIAAEHRAQQEAAARAELAQGRGAEALVAWHDAVAVVDLALGYAVSRDGGREGSFRIPPLDDFLVRVSAEGQRLRALVAVIEAGQADAEAVRRVTAKLEELEQQLAEASTVRAKANEAWTSRQSELSVQQSQLDAWEKTDVLLREPLVGAEQRQLDESAENLAVLRVRARLAEAGAVYREARARLEALRREREDVEEVARRLRSEVVSAWTRLGSVVSTAINSEVIRVGEAGAIEVNLDGEWLDVEDRVHLSAGSLRRMLLHLFIERTEGPMTVSLADELAETLLLPMDVHNRRRLSALAAAKKLRILFEQPAEWDEPRLVHYGGAA